jgi:hypothetical protein
LVGSAIDSGSHSVCGVVLRRTRIGAHGRMETGDPATISWLNLIQPGAFCAIKRSRELCHACIRRSGTGFLLADHDAHRPQCRRLGSAKDTAEEQSRLARAVAAK